MSGQHPTGWDVPGLHRFYDRLCAERGKRPSPWAREAAVQRVIDTNPTYPDSIVAEAVEKQA